MGMWREEYDDCQTRGSEQEKRPMQFLPQGRSQRTCSPLPIFDPFYFHESHQTAGPTSGKARGVQRRP